MAKQFKLLFFYSQRTRRRQERKMVDPAHHPPAAGFRNLVVLCLEYLVGEFAELLTKLDVGPIGLITLSPRSPHRV